MDLRETVRALHAEAEQENERRLLVLAGSPDATRAAAETVVDALDVPLTETTAVGGPDYLHCEHLESKRASELLGTTRELVVFDAHDALRPNALGTVVGAVDGGGLLVLVAPELDAWPARRDAFDESMAVPPYSVDDVTGRFRERFVGTLRAHDGVALVDLDAGTVVRDGLTHPAPRLVDSPGDDGADADDAGDAGDAPFEADVFDACLTADQRTAVRALGALRDSGQAVVVEADRGRGKSAACGLAAGALAASGRDVLVTAPEFRSAAEVFERARALLGGRDALAETGDNGRTVRAADGGCVRFASPVDAVAAVDADGPEAPDALVVDEAAALSVDLLSRSLAAESVAYATTVHGYEGAGRGFDVRFRDRLAEHDHAVTDCHLVEPIRYAAGDPVETWAFHALLLDARPPVAQVVAEATPETARYRRLDADDLLADEHLLREAFGLLVLAHYRTEPADLARVLDAPNLVVRALAHDGHVVSVALLAREGGLDAETRAEMYEGGRVKGNMLPDVLASQLRDEAAGEPTGLRVMRIATHHAVRSEGLGSRLLGEIRAEFGDAVDWIGTGFGATPGLLDFWRANGYRPVHVSTTRNDASGEYSALLLHPTSDAGRTLAERHERFFVERFPGLLGDPLTDLDPDVARAVLRACTLTPDVSMRAPAWRVVAGAAYGPGLFDVAPGAFRDLVVAGLVDADVRSGLTERQERLLVRKALQGHDWPRVAEDLGFHSPGQAMRALGDALVPLVDAYGDETARAVRDRFADN